MHVETAYHCHRDLLELLKNFFDAHIIERLGRGGPHHMSSFNPCVRSDYTGAATSECYVTVTLLAPSRYAQMPCRTGVVPLPRAIQPLLDSWKIETMHELYRKLVVGQHV
jgi:hypothetical protein